VNGRRTGTFFHNGSLFTLNVYDLIGINITGYGSHEPQKKEAVMGNKFEQVKQYLFEMEMPIVSEDAAEQLVVVDDEDNGIKNLVIDCEEPILVLEQVIMKVPQDPGDLFKRLLQMNRDLVHGAFVLDENADVILFRDTLQLENLDRNELEASIHALSLGLAEYSSELLNYAKK
jgi:hypothetical protein